jgi:RecA/RadA recombinase
MMSQSKVTPEKFKLFSVAEMLKLSEPKWLIDKIFPVGSLVGLFGKSGDGKSFVALDWALSVAQGTEWLGRSVRQGAVVYVAAEGGRSIAKRIAAWMKHHAVRKVSDAFFLLEGVQVRSQEDVDLLVTQMSKRSCEPALIVIDTLARCFGDGDENSTKEMNQFVNGLASLQQQTQAAVMVVHHSGLASQERERGSTALRGAADVMIRVSKKKNLITVENNKQKDDEQFEPVKMQLQQVVIAGGSRTSCVLVPQKGNARVEDDVMPGHLRSTLTALGSLLDGTATRRQWTDAAKLPDRTLDSHRQELVERGYVEEVKRGVYRVMNKGLAVGRTGARALLGTAAPARKLHLVKNGKSPSRAAATATTP